MKTRHRIAFGLSGFADNIVATSIAVHLFRFYTDVAGLAPLWVSAGLAVALLWNAFSDISMGRISDRTTWRAGRRRPYILLGAVPVGIAFVMLHMPPQGWSTPALGLYFTVTLLLLFSCKTLVQVPILSLLPEMSADDHERTKLAASREQLGNVGDLLGLLLPIVFSLALGSDARAAYLYSAVTIGSLATLALLVTYFGTYERKDVAAAKPMSAGEMFAALRGNQPFRVLLLAAGLGALALSFVQSMILYVLEHVMHERDERIHLAAFVLNTVAAICSYPLWTRIARHWGKANAFRFGFATSTLAFSSVFLLGPGDYVGLACVMIFCGAANVGFWMFLHSLNADVTDLDALRSGQRREGLFAGFAAWVKKLAVAGASASVGVGLWAIGYPDAGAPNAEIVHRLQYLFAVPPTVLALLALWIFRNYRLGARDHVVVSGCRGDIGAKKRYA